MKYLLIALTLIALYATFYIVRIYYASHYSKNPNIVQEDKLFVTGNTPESGGTNKPLRYIAAGDSTAVGEGASTVQKTYPYQIAQKLSETQTVQYKNIAVRGAKTNDVLTKQLPEIIAYLPDIITISIGANDATHLLSQKTILSNYKAILDDLIQKTQAKIYITDVANFTGAQLLPYPYIKLIEYRSGKINPQIQALTSISPDRISIINIHDFGWENYPNRQVTYSLDHFHPSDTGYENWYNAFAASLFNK